MTLTLLLKDFCVQAAETLKADAIAVVKTVSDDQTCICMNVKPQKQLSDRQSATATQVFCTDSTWGGVHTSCAEHPLPLMKVPEGRCLNKCATHALAIAVFTVLCMSQNKLALDCLQPEPARVT